MQQKDRARTKSAIMRHGILDGLSLSEIAVLWHIIDHDYSASGISWPGRKRLASLIGFKNLRSLTNLLSSLAGRKYIEIIAQPGKPNKYDYRETVRRFTEYSSTDEGSAAKYSSVDEGSAAKYSSVDEGSAAKYSSTDEEGIHPQMNRTILKRTISKKEEEEELFSFRKKLEEIGIVVADFDAKSATKAIGHYGEKRLLIAAQKMKQNPWLCGENDANANYATAKYLFSNKVAQYLPPANIPEWVLDRQDVKAFQTNARANEDENIGRVLAALSALPGNSHLVNWQKFYETNIDGARKLARMLSNGTTHGHVGRALRGLQVSGPRTANELINRIKDEVSNDSQGRG